MTRDAAISTALAEVRAGRVHPANIVPYAVSLIRSTR